MTFLLRSDGKIMLQHRSPEKTPFPDCWDSSSSFHVKFGESYEQAARRELREETGISAQPAYAGKVSYHIPPENEIVAVFWCRNDQTVKIDQSESSGASFHTRDEVNRIIASGVIAPWLRRGWELASRKMRIQK
jgi:isopentenyldiphosphate isomerase